MNDRSLRLLAVLAFLTWGGIAGDALAAGGGSVRVPLDAAAAEGGSIRAVLSAENEVFLEAQPLRGEGYLSFCRRLCGEGVRAAEIRAQNGNGRKLLAGHWYRLNLGQVSAEMRMRVVKALFPDDQAHAGGWRHQVRRFQGLPEESLWRIADRFTGKGENYPTLRLHNELADNTIFTGQGLWVPAELLIEPLRRLLPPAPVGGGSRAGTVARPATRVANVGPAGASMAVPPATGSPVTGSSVTGSPAIGAPRGDTPAGRVAVPEPLPVSVPESGVDRPVEAVVRQQETHRLEYGRDEKGEFAVYHLKPGEALYSSVVVRFTGRIYAKDVIQLASEIAARNSISDVTDMAIGFPVKIPLDLLQPEFLPLGDPRRQEYEKAQRASAQYSNPVKSRDLAGITVILDAGHGGKDGGATKMGVWESVYVYDIMLRLRKILQATTAAEVHTTTRDSASYKIPNRDVLPFSKGHHVLTEPPYSLQEDSRVGVHLRWYLANSLLRKAVAKGRDPEDVVFISIHADSLHPSLRGAMAYIPDAYLRRGSIQKTGAVYTSRREVREKPRVAFSWQQRVKSQGLSRQLADRMIESFEKNGLAVHEDKPVRQKIYRGSRPWVPAVLRHNAVPATLLLEVCNLANDRDRALLKSRAFRQEAAEAVVEGLRAYYGAQAADAKRSTAQSAR